VHVRDPLFLSAFSIPMVSHSLHCFVILGMTPSGEMPRGPSIAAPVLRPQKIPTRLTAAMPKAAQDRISDQPVEVSRSPIAESLSTVLGEGPSPPRQIRAVHSRLLATVRGFERPSHEAVLVQRKGGRTAYRSERRHGPHPVLPTADRISRPASRPYPRRLQRAGSSARGRRHAVSWVGY
jgi:hypothetical protein